MVLNVGWEIELLINEEVNGNLELFLFIGFFVWLIIVILGGFGLLICELGCGVVFVFVWEG